MKENCVIEQTQEIDMTINDIKHSPEVMAFASMFHYGCLGIEKTEADIRASVKRVIDSGYYLQALDVELIYASLVLELFNGRTPVHASVSYPLGNMDKKKKLRDLDLMIRIGVSQCAYCLNYRNILDQLE